MLKISIYKAHTVLRFQLSIERYLILNHKKLHLLHANMNDLLLKSAFSKTYD